MKDVSGVQMILHSKAGFFVTDTSTRALSNIRPNKHACATNQFSKVCLFWFFRASLVSTSPLGDIQKCVTNANRYPKEFIKYISY